MATGAQSINISRSSINVDQLRSLRHEFEKVNGGFTEQQFVQKFASILGTSSSMTTEQLTSLFLKIDANSDGSVDWDEFTSFMFLSNESHTDAEYVPRLYQRSLRKPQIGADDSTTAGPSEEPAGTASEGRHEGSIRDEELAHQLRVVFRGMGLDAERLEAAKGLIADAPRSEVHNSDADIPASMALSSHGYAAIANRPRGETEYLGKDRYKGFQPRMAHRRAHNDLIAKILHIPSPDRYITAGRDGIICVWDEPEPNKLKYRMSFRSGNEWVADLAYMTQSNKLVLVTVEGSIFFYNFSPIVDIVTLVGRITGQRLEHGTPFCVEYFIDSSGNEVLLIGDDGGYLHTLTFTDRAWHACDGHLPSKCHNYEVFRGITCTRKKCHDSGWLTKVRYVETLSSIVTASNAGELRVWDLEKGKLLSQYNHDHGIHNFDWSNALRTMAFCGGDRDVTLWNPYSKKKQATLTGHTAVVVQVAFDDRNLQLATLAKDLSVRIWDMRAQRVVQIFRDDHDAGMSQKWLPTMYLNPKSSSIITTTRTLNVWPLVPLPGTSDVVDDAEVVEMTGVNGAVYNESFHQVISHEASKRSTVFVWDVDTGQLVSQFHKAHGVSPITAICLDRENRRLFSACQVGSSIKTWNFNNGSLLKVFSKDLRHDYAIESDRQRSRSAALDVSTAAGRAKLRAAVRRRVTASLEQHKQDAIKAGRRRHVAASPSAEGLHDESLLLDDSSVGDFSDFGGGEGLQEVAGAVMTGADKGHGAVVAREFKDADKVGQKGIREVTHIFFLERMISPTAGQGAATVQKFVVCVGVDNKLYIFQDAAEEQGTVGYLHCLPSPADEARGNAHTAALKSVVFYPPYTLCTAGQDGTIRMWAIDTGKHMGVLYAGRTRSEEESDHPRSEGALALERDPRLNEGINDEVPAVTSLCFCKTLGLLLAGGEDANLLLFDVTQSKLAQSYRTGHARNESTACIATDKQNELIVTGSSRGTVTVWEVIAPEFDKQSLGLLLPVSQWRATRGTIFNVDVVEHPRLLDTFALCCSSEGVTVWSVSGACVGRFGQGTPWHISSPSTFKSLATHWVSPLDIKTRFGMNFRKRYGARKSNGRGRRSSLADGMFIEEAPGQRWVVPEVGQVWVRIRQQGDTIRKRGVTSKLPDPCTASGQALDATTITAMITVMRVTKDTVVGWNGLSTEPGDTLFVPMTEFSAPDLRVLDPWAHYRSLSARIARIFRAPLPVTAEPESPPEEPAAAPSKSVRFADAAPAPAAAAPTKLPSSQSVAEESETKPITPLPPFKVMYALLLSKKQQAVAAAEAAAAQRGDGDSEAGDDGSSVGSGATPQLSLPGVDDDEGGLVVRSRGEQPDFLVRDTSMAIHPLPSLPAPNNRVVAAADGVSFQIPLLPRRSLAMHRRDMQLTHHGSTGRLVGHYSRGNVFASTTLPRPQRPPRVTAMAPVTEAVSSPPNSLAHSAAELQERNLFSREDVATPESTGSSSSGSSAGMAQQQPATHGRDVVASELSMQRTASGRALVSTSRVMLATGGNAPAAGPLTRRVAEGVVRSASSPLKRPRRNRAPLGSRRKPNHARQLIAQSLLNNQPRVGAPPVLAPTAPASRELSDAEAARGLVVMPPQARHGVVTPSPRQQQRPGRTLKLSSAKGGGEVRGAAGTGSGSGKALQPPAVSGATGASKLMSLFQKTSSRRLDNRALMPPKSLARNYKDIIQLNRQPYHVTRTADGGEVFLLKMKAGNFGGTGSFRTTGKSFL